MTSLRQVWVGVLLLVFASGLAAQTGVPRLNGIFGAGAVDLGQTVTVSVNQFGGIPSGQLYQWSFNGVEIAGATAFNYPLGTATPAIAGTYSVKVTNAFGSAIGSGTLTVRPLAPPAITQQPRTATVQVGQSASFFVLVTGTFPRTYQWRKNGVDIPGATEDGYGIQAVTVADAGGYSVVVSNSEGAVTSSTASLNVNAATPIVLSTSSPSNTTAIQGQRATLSVSLNAGSSPFSFEWRKNGVPVPGVTGSELVFSAVTLADAGTYDVVASNPAGAVTSRSATLTVTPATPVAITQQPAAQTVNVGATLNINVTYTGSSPVTFQWLKNGQPIPNAVSSGYQVNPVAVTDDADYAVIVTNVLGSVTSATAHITVVPATLPVITLQPSSQTINYGDVARFFSGASGSQPVTFRWKKDGVVISTNSSVLEIFSATTAHSGGYVFEATNPAGTVASNVAVLTVRPPALPTITQQPKALAVPLGGSIASSFVASMFVEFTNVGTGPLTFQWLRNGVPIPGATSNSYSPSNYAVADAGDYSVVITGLGGSVQSDIAPVTVLPPTLPFSQSFTYRNMFRPSAVNVGQSQQLSVGGGFEGSPPFAYQWFKEGVAIPGATNFSYNLTNVRESDYANYTFTITNPAGVMASPPLQVRPPDPPLPLPAALPWLDVAQQDDVVYFLATSPARIERYDLAGERWLATVNLTRTPTAFLPTAEGVYIAYSRSLVRLSSDFATETAIVTATEEIARLFTMGEWLYYYNGTGASYRAVNRSTFAAGPAVQSGYSYVLAPQVGVAPGLRKVFTRDVIGDSSPKMVTVAADGTFSTPVGGRAPQGVSFSGMFAGTQRTLVFPNEQYVALDGGAVFRASDLSYAGSLGEDFNDLTFLADGTPVALRRDKLTAFRTDGWLENAQARMATTGLRAFARGTNVFVFGAPATTGTTFPVTKVGSGDFAALPVRAPLEPPTGRYSLDDAFLGADGVVAIFSRSQQALLRWSTATRSFLTSIPLRTAPLLAFHQPGNSRALLLYPNGEFTEIPIGVAAGAERSLGFFSPTNRIDAVTDVGARVAVQFRDEGSSGETRSFLGANGETTLMGGVGGGDYDLAWDPTRNRLYFADNGSTYFRHLADVGPTQGATSGSVSNTTTFARFNSDYSLLATSNGRVFTADLQPAGALANNVLDAAWLAATLYTVRALNGETQLQRWAPGSYLVSGTLTLRGTPVRIHRLDATRLVVVTSTQGRAAFQIVDGDLNVSTDGALPIALTAAPQSQAVTAAAAATFSVSQSGAGADASFQWSRNGAIIAGANSDTYRVTGVQPSATGLYAVTVANAATSTRSAPAILGVSTTAKTVGAGTEVGPNIVHQNGTTYDQVLLQGSAAAVTADAGQVLRVSFVDLNHDIVQVELSGAGTLSLVLDSASGPAPPRDYNQPTVSYLRGHAGIVITGANESTNVTVFSVGRANAVNQALFKNEVEYDGVADIAFIGITSANGKFGGLRAGNTSFFATRGVTGVYAPGVEFTGPVIVGDVNAFDQAEPMLVLGAAADVRVTGGDLAQDNGRAVQVKGIALLQFAAGGNSHGAPLSAKTNRARLVEDGVDVTSRIVPTP